MPTDPFFRPVSGMQLPRFAGIPTFMRLPHVPEDHPRASEVQIGLIGLPFDGGTSNRPGPRHGPRALRDASTMIRAQHPVTGMRPFEVAACADLGDVGPNPVDTADTLARYESAFAAIQEIVALLEADPKTDWSKVNIEAMRQHLIDMDNVTLRASVQVEPLTDGRKFMVSGEGPVVSSIQRMLAGHAATMNGKDGWSFTATANANGAELIVKPPISDDLAKLDGLGFIGLMTITNATIADPWAGGLANALFFAWLLLAYFPLSGF